MGVNVLRCLGTELNGFVESNLNPCPCPCPCPVSVDMDIGVDCGNPPWVGVVVILPRRGTVLAVEKEWVLETVIDRGGVDSAGDHGIVIGVCAVVGVAGL